jgi:hypothetical protein
MASYVKNVLGVECEIRKRACGRPMELGVVVSAECIQDVIHLKCPPDAVDADGAIRARFFRP